jgi:hypothetical protein
VPAGSDALSPLLPIIACKNGNSHAVIDGCKRLVVLKKKGKRSVVCGIIKKNLGPVKAGLLRIGLNAGRQLHPREKLLFIGWLKSNVNQKVYRKYAEKIRLSAGERHEFEQLLLCRPRLTEAVMQGTLDAAVAPEMNHLSEHDAGVIIDLFSNLSFSRQMQRELVEWLPEIAFIRKTALQELLRSGPFAASIADTRLNDPQKVAKIHEEAHSLRFPLYSETKRTWTEKSRRLNPAPSKVSFQASPFFEKDSLEIRIKAEKAEEIHKILQQLASVDLYKWQELIDPNPILAQPASAGSNTEKI